MGKFEHGFGTQLGAVLLWRGVPSASLMLATAATATATTTILLLLPPLPLPRPLPLPLLPLLLLLLLRVPSGSLMLAAWSHQTTAAGNRKRDIFSRNSEGALGSFCG